MSQESLAQPAAALPLRRRCRRRGALLAACLALAAAAARAETTQYLPPACAVQDLRVAPESELLACYAPRFAAAGSEYSYNRIGTPTAAPGWLGGTRVRVSAEQPALYAQLRRDRVAGQEVLQLVYRVHFEKIPLRFSRYFFEAHRNPGVLVMVTLDAATRAPWFVTALPTCGCYLGLVPTRNLPDAWLPNHWPQHERRVFGQQLPARLPDWDARSARLQVELAPASHRVSGLALVSDAAADRAELSSSAAELPLLPLEQLYRLPLAGGARTVSFFHESWPLRGRVRGAWNAMEGLTLFGLVALDPTVGTDKNFGDPGETGVRFYTFLPFWGHEQSRLDRMDGLLRMLDFRLPDALAEDVAG
jgi:hypothetical protein